jgi:hypothetical protein
MRCLNLNISTKLMREKNKNIESFSKMLDQVRGQGAGRRKSAAYMGVCEHFEEDCNADIEP